MTRVSFEKRQLWMLRDRRTDARLSGSTNGIDSPILVVAGLLAEPVISHEATDYLNRLKSMLSEMEAQPGCLHTEVGAVGKLERVILSWWSGWPAIWEWYEHPAHKAMLQFAASKRTLLLSGLAKLWIEMYASVHCVHRSGVKWPASLQNNGAENGRLPVTSSTGVYLLARGGNRGIARKTYAGALDHRVIVLSHAKVATLTWLPEQEAIQALATISSAEDESGAWSWTELLRQEAAGVRSHSSVGAPGTLARVLDI